MASFPRVRGDVPAILFTKILYVAFSPRTRGCSAVREALTAYDAVFPAYAGMFRRRVVFGRKHRGFPRVRGDVPGGSHRAAPAAPFSPRTRGCSVAACLQPTIMVVFPAYAGMFRVYDMFARGSQGFPRVRGDVPVRGQHGL